jgi:hypothetical protein
MNTMDTSSLKEQLSWEMDGKLFTLFLRLWATEIIAIPRAILHDATVFTEPLEYQPERYLKDGQLDPSTRNPDCAAFGFGRR